ncbi:MAG: TolC family protein [Bacteroidales bacterium]|nr:TolC family protein [Bacteroidales bacterium]MDT8431581.1 TolC family protein [Bacteroidales bacterium]
MRPIIPFRIKTPKTGRRIVVLIIFMFLVGETTAQEMYDLERCIQIGLERNFDLLVVRNSEDIAINNYTKGNAGMLPVVTAANRFGGTLNSTSQRYEDGSMVNAANIHNNSGSAEVNMGMTIFRGFQVQNRYQKLGELAELEGLRTQMAIENLVAGIVAEYNYYLQQMTLYDNLAYAVMLSRERVRIDDQRYLLGSASRMQLLQSIVYLNADSSRLARQNEVLRSSQIRLNELMATDDPGEVFLLGDDSISIDTTLEYDALLALTLEENTSLQIASKNRIISEIDYKVIKSGAYPYLSFTSGYGYNYNGYGAGDLLSQQTRGLNYGLTLGMDIFDGFNRKREQSNARIGIESSRIRYEEVEQSVKADLLTIYYAYENNLGLMRLEEQNLKVAQENLEIALERYKLGSLAGLELREVQKSLLDAEERLIYVKYQIKLAEISLLQLSGGIMEYL